MRADVRRAALLLLSCLAPLLPACSPGCEGPLGLLGTARRPEPGGTLTLGLPSAPMPFNPLLAHDPWSQDLLSLLYPSLVRLGGAGEPPLLPSAATAWDIDPSGTTVTFRLRADLAWSDGVPLTAEDVRYSFEAHTAPAVRWPGAGIKAAISGVEVLDDHTVAFHLSRPDPEAAYDCGVGPLLPAHAFSKVPFADWASHDFGHAPVTAGPFLLQSLREDAVELRRNDAWPEDLRPALGTVRFLVLQEERALVDAALAGKVGFVAGIPPSRAGEIRKDPALRLLPVDDYTLDVVSWNTARAPFDDLRLRKAMSLAVDRDALVRSVLPGYGRPAAGPLLSYHWAHDPTLGAPAADRVQAAALLAEAGWADADGDGWLDKDKARLSFSLLVNEESEVRGQLALGLRDQLRALGVQVVVRTLPMAQLQRLLLGHDFEAVLTTWRGSPRVDLGMLTSAAADGGYNFGAFRDAEVDDRLTRAAALPRVQAEPLIREAERRLVELQPWLTLVERQRLDAAARDLEDVRSAPEPLREIAAWRRQPPPPDAPAPDAQPPADGGTPAQDAAAPEASAAEGTSAQGTPAAGSPASSAPVQGAAPSAPTAPPAAAPAPAGR